MKMRMAQWALVLAVIAGTQRWAAAQLGAQFAPEASGPVLSSKAKLNSPDLAKAATSTGREQIAALLRYAADQMRQQAKIDPADWLEIARDQGIIKDIDGVKASAALVQKAIDGQTDRKRKAASQAKAYPALAGAFAWAGDKESCDSYVDKVPDSADDEAVARMYAQMGNMAGVDKALASMDADERSFTYGSIAEDIWIGDPVMGERLLQKVRMKDGSVDDFIAVHYAVAGEIDKATKIAKAADDAAYYWKCIATAYEEKQDFEGAKSAKTAYFKVIAAADDAEQKKRLYTTFMYQMDMGKTDDAKATAQKMSKYALAMIEVNSDKWHIAVAEAACAAAALGDEATVKAMVDAAKKLPNDNNQRDYVSDGVNNGRAVKLLADGKIDAAIDMANDNADSDWGSWRAQEDLYRYAMQHGDVPLALKIEEGAGTTDMLHWAMRELVKMQIDGTPLQGKPVDVFAYIDQKKTLMKNDDIAYDRAEAALGLAEELIRRGGGK